MGPTTRSWHLLRLFSSRPVLDPFYCVVILCKNFVVPIPPEETREYFYRCKRRLEIFHKLAEELASALELFGTTVQSKGLWLSQKMYIECCLPRQKQRKPRFQHQSSFRLIYDTLSMQRLAKSLLKKISAFGHKKPQPVKKPCTKQRLTLMKRIHLRNAIIATIEDDKSRGFSQSNSPQGAIAK